MWENHVRRHQPQYLFVFVADYHFERTVSLFEIGAFTSRLRIRPKFRLDHNRLVREEAPDHDEFVRAQNRVIETEFRGQRSRRRLQFVFPYYIDFLRRTVRLSLGGSSPQGPLAAPLDEDVLKLNFKILETLGRDVARNNARMVIVQVPAAFQSNADLSMLLREFCKLNGFAYIALHEYFQDNANGKPITWNYDGHLNEFGNELLARALAVWLANDR